MQQIVLRHLSKSFTNQQRVKPVLQDVNLAVDSGQFISIVGPSGCGKTTLLRLIAGLDTCSSGELEINALASCAMVFQEHALFPWKNIEANIAAVLPAEMTASEKKLLVGNALEMVGMEQTLHLYPHQLSGGMKQRVNLARALVRDDNILLMDEPFSHLDYLNRRALQDQLLKIWSQNQLTILFVTHDLEEAIYLSDKVLVMGKEQSMVNTLINIEIKRPREYLQTRSEALFAHYLTELTALIEH